MGRLFRWSLIMAMASGVLEGLSSESALALDLTGTWNATVRCEINLPQASFRQTINDVPLLITHIGSDLNVDFTFFMNGTIVENAEKPGHAAIALLACDASVEDPVSFIAAAAKAVVAPDGDARLKGSYIFGAGSVPLTQQCSFRARRVDTTDPAIPPCTVP
jgi:hypothetical protein